MQRRPLRLAVALVVALSGQTASVSAQDGGTLLRRGLQAFYEFDNATAQPLLRRGLNPAAGPQDSTWALGVQSLAQILFDEGNVDLVPLWARFGMRLAPAMALDSVNVIGEVLDAFAVAQRDVAATADDALAPTRWTWPPGDPSGTGRIQVQLPSLDVPVTALVVGRGVISPPMMTVAAGVYRIQVSAPGYRTIEVTREVLPGITTAITFDLGPVRQIAEGTLPPTVRDDALSRSVGLLATRFGRSAPACGGGMLVGRDGLMLTTYRAIRGANSIEVILGGRRIAEGVRVAAYDVASDLALLVLPVIRSDSALVGPAPATGRYVWRLARPSCDAPDVAATRVASGRVGAVAVVDSLGDTPLGSPFVTETGALIGLYDVPGQLIPAERARALMATARDNVANRQTRTLAEVGTAERHLFGSMQVSSLQGATAHVTPLEVSARWPELDVRSPLPMIYAGPAGRYRLTILVGDQERQVSEFTIRAGVADAVAISIGQVAAVPPPAQLEGQRRGGGGFPWLIAALGGVGAGVAALVLLGGGESVPTRGGITITIPDR